VTEKVTLVFFLWTPQQQYRTSHTLGQWAWGLARSRRERWKHGLYSAATRAEQKRARELLIQSREFLKQIQTG
jgi:hypothetical protein